MVGREVRFKFGVFVLYDGALLFVRKWKRESRVAIIHCLCMCRRLCIESLNAYPRNHGPDSMVRLQMLCGSYTRLSFFDLTMEEEKVTLKL